MANGSVSATTNWPAVAAVGVVAVVAVYLLYSANSLLQSLESVTISPLGNLESGIATVLSYLNPANWGNSSDQ